MIENFSIKDDMELGQIANILIEYGIRPESSTIYGNILTVMVPSTLDAGLKATIQNRINSDDIDAPGPERGSYLRVEDVTAGLSYARYHEYTTKILGPGSYRIGWNYGLKINNKTLSGQSRILLDGEEIASSSITSNSTTDLHSICGFRHLTFAEEGIHTITFQIKQSSNAGKATFTFACFEFEAMD